MRFFFLSAFILIRLIPVATAQEDYTWWNSIHHWDGHTSWVQYMTISPARFGPNALPVPELKKGIITDEAELEQLAGIHFHDGDKTRDLFSRVYIPLGNKNAALEMYVVPLEYFTMDTLTRDLRAARTRSGKGSAGGDIYFSTHVQLLTKKVHWPDVMLELAFRTASGTNLRNARYTDGSGYFFDLSFGKKYNTGKKFISEIRPALMAGFYSYQTYDIQHPQNDALLFGAGLDLNSKKLLLSQQFSGYSGYLKNGDQPMVYRCSLILKGKHVNYKLWYEYGIQDFAYQSFRIGIIYHITMNM